MAASLGRAPPLPATLMPMQVSRRNPAPEARLELTPLMDVMFLLLTFFIFAFVLMVRLEVTDITLPNATAGQQGAERVAAVLISLDAEGGVRVDDELVEMIDLPATLDARLQETPDAQLLVATDVDSRSGDLFALVDALKTAGFTELRFIRQPDQPR